MSGTGRPTYRTKKGSSNPAAEYIPSRHVMVRDMPGHKKIKQRENIEIDREKLKEKLNSLQTPTISLDEADEFENADADDDYSTVSSDSSESEDNEAELMNELARMKKEREEDKQKQLKDTQMQIRAQFTTNPLLTDEYSMKQKWTDEAIFHNQAVNEPKSTDRHSNDPLRNDFHRNFLRKYLRT